MKRLVVLSLFIASLPSLAQNIPLSPSAQISLITLGPNQDAIYNAFGHSAIRVMDPALRIDYFYNYGVFTFDDNFYVNFAKGHNRYKLGVYYFPENRDYYISENRSVHEQILNLSAAQKQNLFNFLQWNALPENQYYNYDYFYDNCSTRIRDVLKTVLKGDLQFDDSFIKTHYSIRQLEGLYIGHQPWAGLGINVGLGSPIDKEALPEQYMYLPDYLESFLDRATVVRDGNKVPLVGQKIIIYASAPVAYGFNFLSPIVIFGFILLATVLISNHDRKKEKISRWLDFVFLSVTGIIGTVLLLLWVATDHHSCERNYNLLWALPTNLIASGFVFVRNRPRWLTIYFKGACVLSVLLLICWSFLPQDLSIFLIPLVAALTLRYAVNGFSRQPATVNQ